MTNIRLRDALLGILTSLVSGIALALLLWMLTSIFLYGIQPFLKEGLAVLIENPNLLPESVSPRLGGIGPMLVGSLIVVGLAVLIGFPIGFFTGLYLYEYEHSKIASACMRMLEILVEAPTVCYGVVVYFTLVLALRRLAAIFSSLCLVFILVPYLAIQVRDTLRSLPIELKETCYALGLSTWKTLMMLVRASLRAIVANSMISIARILGETGPLLITAAYYGYWGPWIFNPLAQAPVLTTFIYFAATSPLRKVQLLGWAACLVLTLISMGLFMAARLIGRRRD